MLSHIGADQRHEGSSVRARTTSRYGPSRGEILFRQGWGKVIYTTKSIRAEPIFLVRVLFSSEPCQKFSAV